jgi:disulfide bond formation protein DsbB
MSRSMLVRNPIVAAAALVALAGVATILGAYFFEYVLKYQPCPLCLEQRIAYYVAIPLALAILAAARAGASRMLLIGGLAVIAAAMLWNTGLAAYHAGVEWGWWAGPSDCSGALNSLGGGGGLLNQLQTMRVVRCDEAAWRFLGLSLAGYNVLISLGMSAVALWGIAVARRRPTFG